MRTSRLQVFTLTLSLALSGCGEDSSTPTSPPTTTSPPPPPAAQVLAVFQDPASSFSTSDVRDVHEQIVRFDTTSGALIWAATDQRFSGYPVNGLFIGAFQVRFGTKDGERRAYFTERTPPNICDIEVVGGQLMISATNVTVPGGG